MKVKMKRRICAWISGISFLMSLGAVGGVECGTMPLGKGTLLMFLYFAVSVLAAYKGGYLR